MTYCVGLLVDTGLVMLSDSRTNAGVDQINTFRKMATFQHANDRVLVLHVGGQSRASPRPWSICCTKSPDERRAAAAHLPRQQHVQCRARGGRCAARNPRARRRASEGARPRVQRHLHPGRPDQGRGAAAVSHLFRRQLHRVLASTRPYFQIGESKYGKPIIDRVISRSSSLAQAAKCALVSMDSTIRSNLSVGPPLGSRHHPARRVQARDAYQHRHGQRVFHDDPHALGLRAERGVQRAAESELEIGRRRAGAAASWAIAGRRSR